MIKELYIDGYLVDVDDNFSIVRQLTSPFFSDVTQLKNNGSYSTKIPPTQNNSFIMDYLEREDANTTFPYRVHTANYYEDSFPVFENAEVRVIDAFELQFVWGLNRGKYLPLFTRKLNEIVPNGTTILESDWIVPWKKSNVVYETGKKYKYLNYISGERESEVKIVDGEELPLTEAPEPFLSNLKEMTMHPFVAFTNILDLIINQSGFSIVEKTTVANPLQNKIVVNNVTGLYVGMILYAIVDIGDNIHNLGIKITDITDTTLTFSENVFSWYLDDEPIFFADNNIKAFEFDDLKTRIGGKGLILGGNLADKSIEYTRSFPSDETYEVAGLKTIQLTAFTSSFVVGSISNTFFLNQRVWGVDRSLLEIDIEINADQAITEMGLYKYDENGNPEKIEDIEYTDMGVGARQFKKTILLDSQLNVRYFIAFELSFSITYVIAGSYIVITNKLKQSMYSMIASPTIDPAHYNCLMNLPDMTAADFINQMLIMTGLFVGHDTSGNMKFLSLDNFKANLLAGNINDWSGKVSQSEKSYFQFNSNAQKNWIKFANSDDRTYTANDSIVVDDTTLDTEKDLYTISFDLAEQAASGIAEFILYKQKVASSEKTVTEGGEEVKKEVKSFSQDYNEKPSVCVYDSSGTAIIENVLPNGTIGFIAAFYGVYKDIVYRPRVLDIVVKLPFLDALNIDFEKPVYIPDYGKYAVLLDIKIPDDGLCNAKILLINQTL